MSNQNLSNPASSIPVTAALLLTLALAACGGGADAGADTAPPDVASMSEAELVEYAQGVHDRVITLDTHDDINAANFTAEQNYTMDLTTQVTTLLFRAKLVLKVNPGRTCLNHSLHHLKGVERTSKTRLGVSNNGSEPITINAANLMMSQPWILILANSVRCAPTSGADGEA